MERTSSRRRIRKPRDELQDPPRASSELSRVDTTSDRTTLSRSCLASVIIFLILLVSFLGVPKSPNIAHENQAVEQSLHSDIGQKLHPETHIYRPVTTIRLNWTVTAAYLRPDGVLKRIYVINGVSAVLSLLGSGTMPLARVFD
ncbi:hypothetical protein I7I51_08500 [Histoplasma capsulatum]|uniref:Uncharacterized protein n=2 Tax=Histoplasma TaxID=5036 RepID=A0A8A1LY11_AJECA|nr:hypothetical protein I7I51_08500 [Histoplasma capsulatum]